MNSVSIHVRKNCQQPCDDRLIKLHLAGSTKNSSSIDGLVFFDEQDWVLPGDNDPNKIKYPAAGMSPQGINLLKFTALMLASPLCSFIHLVRSICFLVQGELKLFATSFLGAFGYPAIAAGCWIGALFAYGVSFINEESECYIPSRRVFAYFEAWVNGIRLNAENLGSRSGRVGGCFQIIPKDSSKIWMAASCMQPFFEKGLDKKKGLKNLDRVDRLIRMLAPILLEKNARYLATIKFENEEILQFCSR